MSKRLLGVFIAFLLVFAAPVASGVEQEQEQGEHDLGGAVAPPADMSQLGSGSETASGFLPDEPEPPMFFRWFYYPLIVLALLVVVRVLFSYLLWQPRFAEERRAKRRR